MNTLTERIRAARERAGLTQTDVAKALRISASAVNQWEHGFSKNIKLTHFFALASLLEEDPQWLATGKTHPRARMTATPPPVPNPRPPTGEERALLLYVRQMPDTLRKLVIQFLRKLTEIYGSRDKPDHGA